MCVFDGTDRSGRELENNFENKKGEKLDGSWVSTERERDSARLMDGYDALSRSHINKPYMISTLCIENKRFALVNLNLLVSSS